MFSFGNGAIWKHDPEVKTFQTLHGKYQPHIIEFATRSTETLDAFQMESLIIGTQADEYLDSHYLENRPFTFDRAAVYNTYQSTGIMTLEERAPNNSLEAITQRNDIESTFRSKFDYRLNTLTNKVPIGREVVEYDPNSYLTDVIEYDTVYEKEDFYDKYFYQRYILDNEECDNVELFTRYVLSDHSYYTE